MAAVHHPGCPHRDSLFWDETDCQNYYGMLSLHEVFEVVGCQLTQTDIEVLSFLLDEACPAPHPLDPTGWTVEPCGDDPNDPGVSPSPELLKAWMKLKPQGSQGPLVASCTPKSGLELLLELEKRGYLSDGNLEPLLQLLRVLTRHDLLPLASHKRRPTVTPERPMPHSKKQTEIPQPYCAHHLRTGIIPPVTEPSASKGRKRRGNGWSCRPKRTRRTVPPLPPPPQAHQDFCNIRLRVRAEYLEHESALREGVSSDKQQPLERQFELFSKANTLLHARDLGTLVCVIKFTDVDNLESFWADYLSGALLEAMKGVFITDSLRRAAGREDVRLMMSVDQDDYEEGRMLLRERRMVSSSKGGVD
ncbi:death effector domain-containing 1 [Trematomus bernacchii]|uniref:death effector domain-containing 1 n=1 Tax=Trematomus bernacchii TaxID=40690 RepID=UPI00146B0705|nr:death effector domain-containing 1 [Trematomus bernacchii]XP_033979900.1 death effector domain-containing 1 [Trematomus bernacchii]